MQTLGAIFKGVENCAIEWEIEIAFLTSNGKTQRSQSPCWEIALKKLAFVLVHPQTQYEQFGGAYEKSSNWKDTLHKFGKKEKTGRTRRPWWEVSTGRGKAKNRPLLYFAINFSPSQISNAGCNVFEYMFIIYSLTNQMERLKYWGKSLPPPTHH